MGVDKHMLLVCGSKLNLLSCGGIETDLLLECVSNGLDFRRGVEINSIFV